MSQGDQFQIREGAAQFYDRLPARYLLGPWSASLVAAAKIAPTEQVLDLACGTGVVAREVEQVLAPGGRVVGLDINEGMINVANTNASGREKFPTYWPVHWTQGFPRTRSTLCSVSKGSNSSPTRQEPFAKRVAS